MVQYPGYIGMSTFGLVTPLILNSRWDFMLAAITAAVWVLRTALEDLTLERELDGYADYAGQVKQRLVPVIRQTGDFVRRA